MGISLHAEGEKVVLVHEDGKREAVDLRAPEGSEAPPRLPAALSPDGSPLDLAAIRADRGDPQPPGTSPLDDFLRGDPTGGASDPDEADVPDVADEADATDAGGAQ